jgi:hypothetical protein
MKKAIVYVNSCLECPYMTETLAFHEKPKGWCELLSKYIEPGYEEPGTIPEECPLDDVSRT